MAGARERRVPAAAMAATIATAPQQRAWRRRADAASNAPRSKSEARAYVAVLV